MIKYYVNKDKGIVKAKFDGGITYWRNCLEKMVQNIIGSDCRYIFININALDFVNKYLNTLKVYDGIAKLNPADTWNEQLGKNIAKRRLNLRFNRVKNRILYGLRSELARVNNIQFARINKKLSYDFTDYDYKSGY